VLRGWTAADRAPFGALNADPEVMRHFPTPLTREQSDAFADLVAERFAADGFGLWALEVVGGARFVGSTGIWRLREPHPYAGAVEAGWRLARSAWGRGYATEAARAAVAYGFDEVGLDEIVSTTSVSNVTSQAVMERLGMTRDPGDDYDHPSVPAGSPLRRHLLYRLTARQWRQPGKGGVLLV